MVVRKSFGIERLSETWKKERNTRLIMPRKLNQQNNKKKSDWIHFDRLSSAIMSVKEIKNNKREASAFYAYTRSTKNKIPINLSLVGLRRWKGRKKEGKKVKEIPGEIEKSNSADSKVFFFFIVKFQRLLLYLSCVVVNLLASLFIHSPTRLPCERIMNWVR